MIQRGYGTRLLLEATQAIGVGGEGSRQNLDGDIASQAEIAGAIDFAHSAGADQCNKFVGSEFGTRSEGHEVCCIIA
jgi:hypothetical protein